MFYAVIDTNVLVSALLNINSKPGKVLLSVFNEETRPLLNAEIIAEYRDVLARKKFHFPAETVDIVMNRLAAVSMNINAAEGEFPEITDPKDRCFFAVTMTGRLSEDTLLVTGNIRHFPAKPFVVTPAQFIELLESQRQS